MKKLVLVQTAIIFILIVILSISLTKKSKIIETKVITSIPIVSEHLKCSQNKKINQTKNILFIGNSITWHDTFSNWWGKWGMAASKKEKDFVHQVAKKLSEKYNLNLKIVQFYSWEAMSHDRAETLQLLDPALTLNYDYIVIQLGENIFDTSALNADFTDLINYLKKSSPNAQFVIVGQYWENKEIEKVKEEVCKNHNLDFVDLGELKQEKENAGVGTVVFGDDGKEHIIDAKGVGRHPGDEAMSIIAEKIFNVIE